MDPKSIRPLIIQGRPHWQVGDSMFPSYRAACEALQAAQSHHLDLLDVFARFRASVRSVAINPAR